MAYELTADFYYPASEIYEGGSQICRFAFSAPVFETEWYANRMIDKFEKEVTERGEDMLRLRVWEDHSPIMETKFVVEVSATSSPAWPAGVWYAIIGAVIVGFIVFGAPRLLKITESSWPYIATTAKWIGISVASVAVIAIVRALAKALPKRRKA